jgi:hypothetical protein
MHLQVCPHRSQRVAWRSFRRMGLPSAAAASRRDTVNELYDCAGQLVQAARELGVAVARSGTAPALAATLGCLEASLEALAQCIDSVRARIHEQLPPTGFSASRRAKCPCGPRGPSAGARSGLPRRPCGTKGRRAARRRRRASLSSDGFGPATARRCALSRGRVGRHPRGLVGCVSRRGATESAPLVLPSRYIGHREILLPGGGAQHRVKHP